MVGFGNCKGSRLIRMNKGSVLTACPLQDDSVSVGLGSVSEATCSQGMTPSVQNPRPSRRKSLLMVISIQNRQG